MRANSFGTEQWENFLRGANVMTGLETLPCSDYAIASIDDHVVYINGDAPFWFVPNGSGHEALTLCNETMDRAAVLHRLAERNGKRSHAYALDVMRLFRTLTAAEFSPYRGRASRELTSLAEVWFHLTDTCNARCTHCLFSDNAGSARSLSLEDVHHLSAQAGRLGAKVFCFTGGEPLTHPSFREILQHILIGEDHRVAVLTNGLLIPSLLPGLKNLDRTRMHFQVSLDGPQSVHDTIRGEGSFDRAVAGLRALTDADIPCSVSMAVNPENVEAMTEVVGITASLGVPTLHFMWHFRRGQGRSMEILPQDVVIRNFDLAVEQARSQGLTIDNLEAIRAQVFTHPGTRFDLGNAGWESLTIGPDRAVYPTPALVDLPGFHAGSVTDDLEAIWRESPVLRRVRSASLLDVPAMASDPWRFIIGGGDFDHCCMNPRKPSPEALLGDDPYRPLYIHMAVRLIADAVAELRKPQHPGLILRMGDITTDCPSGQEVNFTHCNCLLSMGDGSTQGLVRNFYAERAEEPDELILNPVVYDEDDISFIPQEARARMYGCGSPVADAQAAPGEVLVDLGSGSGVECFLAARAVGPHGAAIGVDMTDAMLAIAERAQENVHQALGYANTQFRKGYLEDLPLEDGTADVIISNCVVNLSHNKRRVFSEIHRVLKPGGRLVISDVAAETEPPLAVRGDHQLLGECIGGALVQEYLFHMLLEIGFVDVSMLKRFPYRVVHNHPFFSLTFRAYKPAGTTRKRLLYGGPLQAVTLEGGFTLHRGIPEHVDISNCLTDDTLAEMGINVLDESTGQTINSDAESCCACVAPPLASSSDRQAPRRHAAGQPAARAGCLICGSAIEYLDRPEPMTCVRCGAEERTSARCLQGHFICDACHLDEPRQIIQRLCLQATETDMIALLKRIRRDPAVPLHGPEHHGLVPGIILAAYRNAGGPLTDRQIMDGIDRGMLIPGGSCAFLGACGAASGVGTGFAAILDANPLKPGPRQVVMEVVAEVLRRFARFEAARCCQRECYLALRTAAEYSGAHLDIPLQADEPLVCTQFANNHECIEALCPLHPAARKLRPVQ